jgi:hypothetical protein
MSQLRGFSDIYLGLNPVAGILKLTRSGKLGSLQSVRYETKTSALAGGFVRTSRIKSNLLCTSSLIPNALACSRAIGGS